MEDSQLMNRNLGRLERVDIREIWAHEALDFTPWLAKEENLKLLGDTIGIELELVAVEVAVGPFRADILCKSKKGGYSVLIENQLEQSDFGHLGQILTYASGLNTVVIIWIAKHINEQHRAALDWLNDITPKGINFLGLEIEAWKIGDSDVAPKFNIVSKGNDWKIFVRQLMDQDLSVLLQDYVNYWTQFGDYVIEKGSIIKPRKPQPTYFMSMAIGRTGFELVAGMDYNAIVASINISTEESKEHFAALLQDRAEIENEIGEELVWNPGEGKHYCSIELRRECDPTDKTDWAAQHEWFLEKLEKLHKAFYQRIRDLK